MLNNKEYSNYELFIDELGIASPNDYKSDLYILSGCSINKNERYKLKILIDQIKFKYWGHTNIIFHSREIGRKGEYEEIMIELLKKKIFRVSDIAKTNQKKYYNKVESFLILPK